MKKIMVWETSASVAGGQKMTLTVMDLLKDKYEFCCLIPGEGELSAELEKRGIPYLLMGDQTLPSGVKGKQVYFRYGWMSLKNIVKSISAIRKTRPDILYAPGPASLPWSAICGSLTRRPVVWHLHHVFMDGATAKLLSFFSRSKSVKRILAVSHCVGDQVGNPKGHEKVRVFYNPIDSSRYVSGDADVVNEEMTRMLGQSQRELLLTEIAVLRKDKAQDRVIHVVQALKRKGVNAKGILVGEAITDEDRSFKEKLQRLIEDSGLQSDIYLAGYRTNVRDYLAAADFVMVPAVFEGLSFVAQEAMTAGRDVVVPATGGAAEMLNAAGCGIHYPLEATPDEIADLILKAKGTDRSREIENGREFCRGLSHEAYQKKMLTLLSEL